MVKQLSVFIENKKAALSEVIDVLSEKNINLRALSIADTADFGILRLITDDVDYAAAVLKSSGFIVKVNSVIAATVSDEPGAMAKILKILVGAGIGIEYSYAFSTAKEGKAGLIIRTTDKIAAAAALEAAGIKVAEQADLF